MKFDLTAQCERLKTAVQKAGGATAVARCCGVPLGSLNRYLAGRDMQTNVAKKVARACNVSIEWLIEGGEMLKTPKNIGRLSVSASLSNILGIANELSIDPHAFASTLLKFNVVLATEINEADK